jgi:oligopeptide transport system substrate-binding protein
MVLAMMLGAASVLTACGKPKDDGAHIAVYLGDCAYDLDPSDYFVSDNAAELMRLIYEPLFNINEKGKLKCAAADDYKVDKDTRTIVITLKESYWSDGAQVKADDYVYAWRDVILNPNNANAAAPLLYDIENAVEVKSGELSIYDLGLSASLFEITIKYREGADYEQLLKNLASVATAPVREDVVNLAPGHWSKNANTIVTNGPFKIKNLDYNFGELTLERNIGYHQPTTAKKYTDQVTPYLLMSTFSVAGSEVKLGYNELVNNTVFYLGEASLADRKAHKDDAIVGDLASTYCYVFDTTNPLFANKNVRKALSLAINRDAMVAAITFAKPATGLLSSVSSADMYTKKIPQALISSGANMEEARKLLASVDFTGISKKFTLTVENNEESLAMASLAEASWEQLGFDVTVKPVTYVTSSVKDKQTDSTIDVMDSTIQYYVKGAADGLKAEFDVIGIDLQTYSTGGFAALCGFTSKMNGNGVDLSLDSEDKNYYRANITGWSNETYDKYIMDAYKATDADVRAENLRKAEALLVSEAPIIPVVFNQSFAFVSKELKKVEVDGLGNIVLTEAKLKDYEKYIKTK